MLSLGVASREVFVEDHKRDHKRDRVVRRVLLCVLLGSHAGPDEDAHVCAIFVDQKPILRITKRGKNRMTSMISAQIPGA